MRRYGMGLVIAVAVLFVGGWITYDQIYSIEDTPQAIEAGIVEFIGKVGYAIWKKDGTGN